jgi:hypothetical protein
LGISESDEHTPQVLVIEKSSCKIYLKSKSYLGFHLTPIHSIDYHINDETVGTQ